MLLLPLLLAAWAATARGLERMPALRSLPVGLLLIAGGILLWSRAVLDLWRRGGGLPMNAYPPPRHVSTGAFAIVRHPIYAGFGLAVAGAALASGNAAALWLVLPVTLLAMAALVLGHEGPALRARFGRTAHTPLLRVPAAADVSPTAADRISIFALVFVPWLLGWGAVQVIGMPADAFTLALPFDRRVPVIEWTYAIYASTYLVLPLLPLLPGTQRELRDFAFAGWFATALIVFVWLVLPVSYLPTPFVPQTAAGHLLLLDRAWCTGMAAFPSFHVVWTCIAAEALTRRAPRLRAALWLWAVLVAASCLTTGMHGALDIAAGFAAYVFVRNRERVWERLRLVTERIANGWREWRIGSVRVINHGVFGGLGAALGVGCLLLLAPAEPRWAAITLAAACIAGAAAWAQLIESSSGLLRPFGYYGAVLGAAMVACFGPLLGFDGAALLAALALSAPWIQFLGRIRCLIQGCCHGHPASARVGIRYTHPRSRVSYLAGLAGAPLHPTPLYSMLGNVVLGIVLARLWTLGVPQSLVIGGYLIGNGLARFVEEGFRGEPQTPVLLGLRLYQWLAVGFVVAGAAVTTVTTPDVGASAAPDATSLAWMLAFLVATTFAMGVDFPESNRRFSRLAT